VNDTERRAESLQHLSFCNTKFHTALGIGLFRARPLTL